MNNLVLINDKELKIKEFKGERVVTFKEVDLIHERAEGTAKRNFTENKKYFIKNVDYFEVSTKIVPSLELYGFSKFAPNGVLMTESGYLMLVKSLTDDLAWTVQRELVNNYFRVKENEQQPKLPTTYKEALQHLIEQVEVNEKLQLEGKMKDQVIKELKPKADYTDMILKNKGLVTITQIAKDYGMSGKEMNKILHERGIQYKQSGQWLLYKQHQGKGYTHSETIDITRSDGMTDVKMTTKWTQKGRLFLYDLLKTNNILPDIEKEYSYQTSMLG
ncbi:phage antirepressor KilAC domain-containing protein [Clostridioides difficile]|nr:phage antirepressor KilAC domain-containing protein [Clostridioides difficile]EKS6825873.1 phage antirepressor KilAC domain-containing protein [Clostridioides difficile]MCZ8510553.1 phage antirepressor KilAC domain-containing protein [Clostridioides difficile]MDO0008129.1 phage antirepressor KilAC domain-containing protein [Clostridioides difficile]HBF9348581.1 phage antirepressor KilAC domain-containing protein [Clostridioides difficile]